MDLKPVRCAWLVLLLLLPGCGFFDGVPSSGHRGEAYVMRGIATWYGTGFYGRRTANGEIYTGKDLTAAHRTLPFGTRVRVTRLDNGQSVVVRINDRGPSGKRYIIDLSRAAAREIDMKSTIKVEVRTVDD